MSYTYRPTAYGTMEVFEGDRRISTVASSQLSSLYPSAVLAEGFSAGGMRTTSGTRNQARVNGVDLDKKLAKMGDQEAQQTVEDTQGVDLKEEVTGDELGATTNEKKEKTREEEIYEGANKEKEIADAESRAQKEKDDAEDTLDDIYDLLNTSSQRLIESIKKTYEARIDQMKDTNKRIAGAKQTAGYRSGRARYTPELQSGILSDEEQQGIMRVTQLEGEMLSLIAQAERAQAMDQLDIFNERMDRLTEIDNRLQEETENLLKAANDQLEAMREAEKEALELEEREQELITEKVESNARAIADATAHLSEDEQIAALTIFAEELGTDFYTLYGYVAEIWDEQEEHDLEMESKRSLIAQRKRSGSEPSASDKKEAQKEKDYEYLDTLIAEKGATMTADQLFADAQRNTSELSDSEIRTALDVKEYTGDTLTDDDLKKVAEGAFKGAEEDMEAAIEGIQGLQSITFNGKKYALGDEQKEVIIAHIRDSGSWWEKFRERGRYKNRFEE